jgi:hypothetical protein
LEDMSDYAAAPIQPIVQGLLTVDPVSLAPTFTGRGVRSVTRTTAAGPPAQILYTLFLDPGLPGNAGELQPSLPISVAFPVGFPTQPDARSLVTVRGSATNAIPGSTSIANVGVFYSVPSAGPGTDGGDTAILLVFTNAVPAAVDPTGAVASGVEIIVWKGL